MKTSLCLLIGLCLLLPAAACGKKAAKKKPDPSMTTTAGEGPQAMAVSDKPSLLPEPKPDETIYAIWVRNDEGLPIAGVKTMLLVQPPEGLYLEEPRRKTVAGTFKTPTHGRVHYAVVSDGKPKFLWIGAEGMDPFVKELPAARAGSKFEQTITVEILPILSCVILDHEGNRVTNAIVTMRPAGGGGKMDARMQDQFKRALRTGDLGELKITRPLGSYVFIATKPNGTCRLTETIDWDGDPEEKTFRLPEKSPGK